MVLGANSRRYVWRSSAGSRGRARRARRCPRGCRSRATGGRRRSRAASPPRCLPRDDGSAYVSEPSSSVLSITTSYSSSGDRVALGAGDAEAPRPLVVRRAGGNPVRVLGQPVRCSRSSLPRHRPRPGRCSRRRGGCCRRHRRSCGRRRRRSRRRGCSTLAGPSSRDRASRRDLGDLERAASHSRMPQASHGRLAGEAAVEREEPTRELEHPSPAAGRPDGGRIGPTGITRVTSE